MCSSYVRAYARYCTLYRSGGQFLFYAHRNCQLLHSSRTRQCDPFDQTLSRACMKGAGHETIILLLQQETWASIKFRMYCHVQLQALPHMGVFCLITNLQFPTRPICINTASLDHLNPQPVTRYYVKQNAVCSSFCWKIILRTESNDFCFPESLILQTSVFDITCQM